MDVDKILITCRLDFPNLTAQYIGVLRGAKGASPPKKKKIG